MCTGGRIIGHLKRFLPRPNTTVALVGYQGANTLGRQLANHARHVTIDDRPVPVKAQIATLSEFSAHADSKGLIEWARGIPGDKIRWFVNHGEAHAARTFGRTISESGLGAAYAVREQERVVVG